MAKIFLLTRCRYCPARSWRGLGGHPLERWDVCVYNNTNTFEMRIWDIDKLPNWCPLPDYEEVNDVQSENITTKNSVAN